MDLYEISTPDSQMSNSLTVAYCPYFKNPHIHQFRAIRMKFKKGFLIWQAPSFSQEFFKDMNKNILLSGIISFHLDFLHLTQIWRFFFLVLQWLKFKNPYATLFGQLDFIERTIKHEEKSPVVFVLSIEILNFKRDLDTISAQIIQNLFFHFYCLNNFYECF